MELLTERLRIRAFSREDLDAYAAIVADPAVMRFLGDGRPHTRATAEAYVDDVLARQAASGVSRYAVTERETGEFIGFCGYKDLGDYVDLGWRYGQRWWGRGIATEAARAVFAWGVETLGLTNIAAGADAEHHASLAVIRKLPLPCRVDVEVGGRPAVFHHQRPPARRA